MLQPGLRQREQRQNAPVALPGQVRALPAPPQRAQPAAYHLVEEAPQAGRVAPDAIIGIVATQNRAEPALLLDPDRDPGAGHDEWGLPIPTYPDPLQEPISLKP